MSTRQQQFATTGQVGPEQGIGGTLGNSVHYGATGEGLYLTKALKGAGLLRSGSAELLGQVDATQLLVDRSTTTSAAVFAGALLLMSASAAAPVTDPNRVGAEPLATWHMMLLSRIREVASAPFAFARAAHGASGYALVARSEAEDLVDWGAFFTLRRPSAGRIRFHMKERAKRAFRFVEED